jgi:hypothetical protein
MRWTVWHLSFGPTTDNITAYRDDLDTLKEDFAS